MMDQMEGWEDETGYMMGRVGSVVASKHEDDAEYEGASSDSDSAAQGLPIDECDDTVYQFGKVGFIAKHHVVLTF